MEAEEDFGFIALEEPEDDFGFIPIDGPSQGFGDLKVAERGLERDAKRTALLEEQNRARFDTAFDQDNLRAIETAEQVVTPFSTPIKGAIHGTRQALGIEDPNNPLPIVPTIPRTTTENVKSFIPDAMPGVAEVIAGTQQAAAGLGDFLLDPDYVALGGIGRVGKAIQGAAGSIFTADMASHIPEQGERLVEAIKKGTTSDITREYLNTVLTVGGAVAPIAHSALPKATQAVKEKFEVERPGESKWSKVPEKLPEAEKFVQEFNEKAPELAPEPIPETYQSLSEKLKGRTDFDSPEFQSLWKQREELKNENEGFVPVEEVKAQETIKPEETEVPDQTQRAPDLLDTGDVEIGQPEVPKTELTQPEIPETVSKVSEPTAETITGPDEQKGSEMPAERPGRPKSVQSQRPHDLIDELEANLGGKLSLPLAKKLIEDFKPTGRLRKLFKSEGGYAPDIARQSIEHFKQFGDDAEFLQALSDAAEGRKTFRSESSKSKSNERIEEKQFEQFEEKAIRGVRPKSEKGGIESVRVNDLVEGDQFNVQGHRFKVKSLEIDEDGNLISLEVHDGPKFGVQRLSPENTELIHVDTGTFKAVPRIENTDFLPSEEQSNVPKLRSMENQGDLLSKQTEDLSLVGERGTDFERIQSEKLKKEKDQEEAKAIQDKQQRGLIGMGGAIPEEFKPSNQSPTSIKNAQVDAERLKRGMPPAMARMRQTFQQAWDEAMNIIDHDPGKQDRLIQELSENPRALNDPVENALLLHRQVDLQNELGKAMRDLAQAFDDGRMEAVELEKARVDRAQEELGKVYDIADRVGTKQGQALNARKMFANEDFTLASLTLQKRAAKGGKPLTTQETLDVQKIADEYKTLSEILERSVAERDQRIADLEAKKSYDQLVRETQPSNYVLKIAEKIVSGLDKRANAARERLKAKWARTSTGVDPTILIDVAEIGASHMAKLGLDFAKWSAKMIEELGDNVKPYLEEGFKAAQKLIDDQASKLGGRMAGPKVSRAVKKADTNETVSAAKEKVAAGEKINVRDLAHKLARQFVAQGVKGFDPVLDATHNALKEIVPDISRRDTMDAISGYGDFKELSKNDIDVQLRDLKGQYQQVAKLQDMQAGKAPEKTGVERRTPSDAERALIKQVEEAKRRGGYTVTDPAKQLKTALEAVKTRLRNSITDLESQIASKTKIVKKKTDLKYDEEADALKARRDELKKEFDEIFGKRELTDEQRTQMAIRAVERSITEYERRIKEGDLFPGKKPSKTPNSPALEAVRARRDALKEQLKELQDIANPKKTPEERALQSYKTRTANRIAELEEKLAKGDFSKKKPREYAKDTEAVDLKYKLERVKRKWNEELFKDKLKNRTKAQQAADAVKETLLFQKAWKTAFDLSAIFRQGGFVALGNPVRALKIMPDMFRAMKSEKEQFRIEEEIRNRPNASLYQEAGLFLSGHADTLTKMEEAYLGRWAEKVPLVSHSSRAYTTFLNRLRADSFDALTASLAKNGKPTLAESKAIANFVNVATGRGSVGPTSNMGVTGFNLFFAPRYVVSRFQLMGGRPLYKGYKSSTRSGNLVAKEYAKTIIGLATVYGLAKAAGWDIETDWNSSDFGKVSKDGEIVIDPLFGMSQQASFAGKMISGEVKNTRTGEKTNIRGEVPYGKPDAEDVFWRYVRSKLSPAASMAFDVTTGKNFDGSPIDAKTLAENALVPINVKDVVTIMKQNGIPEGVALSMLNTMGMTVSSRKED